MLSLILSDAKREENGGKRGGREGRKGEEKLSRNIFLATALEVVINL